MPNYDNPNGFEVLGPVSGNRYTLAGTVAKGDLCRLGAAGTVTVYNAHQAAIGIALRAGVSGDEIEIADSPFIEIVGQCSGTFAATNIGDQVDVEGTTGIMEVNEDATTYRVLTIVRHIALAGSESIGANSRVVCVIARHQKAAEQTSGAGTFDSLLATTSITADTAELGGGYASTGISTTAAGNLSMAGNLVVDGTSTLTGAVTVGGGFGATGVTISAAGAIDANGAVGIDGALRVGAAGASLFDVAAATGNTQIDGTLEVDGAVGIDGALRVGAAGASLFDVAAATGNTQIDGTLEVDGAVGVDGAFRVGAAGASLFDVAAATGNTQIDGTLEVDGAVGIDGAFRVGAAGASLFDVAAASGNTQIDGTLEVDGATGIDGAFRVGTAGASNATISAAGALTAVTALARPARSTRVEHYQDFLQAAGSTLPLPYGKAETSAAGTMTIDFVDTVSGGIYTITHDATDELQTGTLHWADKPMIDPAKGPIMEFRARVNNGNPFSADQRVVMGLGSALNATLDSVASCAWFRLEGASMALVVEGDDGTTDSNDVATGITLVDNTWTIFRIDMTTLTAIAFAVDGVACSTTVSAPLLTVSNLLQPYFCIQKDGGTETDALQIDYVQVWYTR